MNKNLIQARELLKTGWQSFSWDYPGRIIKFPLFNYPPQPIDRLDMTTIPSKVKLRPRAFGWCSWYAFGPDINEEIILKQSQWFKENSLRGLEYILIDSGWVTKWGDWLTVDKKKFPSGLKNLSGRVKELGLKSGIWVAPFLVDPNSRLAKEHPNWLAKKDGEFVEGLRLTSFDKYLPYKKYILDVTNSEVVDYLDTILSFLLKDCGFDLIKLDFLYGLYFNPNLTTLEADQFLQSLFLKIRKLYPDVYTIGCGCPLVPAVGAVDSMRIGPDTLFPFFQDVPFLKEFTNKYQYKKVIGNIHARMWTKRFWNIDSDAFVCREDLGISDDELMVFQKLIIACEGNIFLGDDMTHLPKERVSKFIQPLFDQ
jgi:alpha-galactosidase